jgi:hypothetical protein
MEENNFEDTEKRVKTVGLEQRLFLTAKCLTL